MDRWPRQELMRAKIGGKRAAADETPADCRAAQFIFEEDRQAPAEAPLDAGKHLKCWSGELIFERPCLDRAVRALHLDMRISKPEPNPAIGDEPRSSRASPPHEVEGDEIVAMREFKALEGG